MMERIAFDSDVCKPKGIIHTHPILYIAKVNSERFFHGNPTFSPEDIKAAEGLGFNCDVYRDDKDIKLTCIDKNHKRCQIKLVDKPLTSTEAKKLEETMIK